MFRGLEVIEKDGVVQAVVIRYERASTRLDVEKGEFIFTLIEPEGINNDWQRIRHFNISRKDFETLIKHHGYIKEEKE